jgi:Integrase core domain
MLHAHNRPGISGNPPARPLVGAVGQSTIGEQAAPLSTIFESCSSLLRPKMQLTSGNSALASLLLHCARPNQCWSMDFVSDKLVDGRSFRILTVVDQFTRECVAPEDDRSMTGMKVAYALDAANQERGCLPESITVDNGSEFCSRAGREGPRSMRLGMRSQREPNRATSFAFLRAPSRTCPPR